MQQNHCPYEKNSAVLENYITISYWYIHWSILLSQNTANTITSIHMENLDKSTKLPSQIMEDLLTNFKIPEEKQVQYSPTYTVSDEE